MEVCNTGQEAVIKSIPKKKKCKKAKWLSEDTLQIAEKRTEAKGKGEKERYTHLNVEFQRITRVKKAERRRIDAFELWCWRRLYTWTSADGQH